MYYMLNLDTALVVTHTMHNNIISNKLFGGAHRPGQGAGRRQRPPGGSLRGTHLGVSTLFEMELCSEDLFAKWYDFGCNFWDRGKEQKLHQNCTVKRFCACRGHKQSRNSHLENYLNPSASPLRPPPRGGIADALLSLRAREYSLFHEDGCGLAPMHGSDTGVCKKTSLTPSMRAFLPRSGGRNCPLPRIWCFDSLPSRVSSSQEVFLSLLRVRWHAQIPSREMRGLPFVWGKRTPSDIRLLRLSPSKRTCLDRTRRSPTSYCTLRIHSTRRNYTRFARSYACFVCDNCGPQSLRTYFEAILNICFSGYLFVMHSTWRVGCDGGGCPY